MNWQWWLLVSVLGFCYKWLAFNGWQIERCLHTREWLLLLVMLWLDRISNITSPIVVVEVDILDPIVCQSLPQCKLLCPPHFIRVLTSYKGPEGDSTVQDSACVRQGSTLMCVEPGRPWLDHQCCPVSYLLYYVFRYQIQKKYVFHLQ